MKKRPAIETSTWRGHNTRVDLYCTILEYILSSCAYEVYEERPTYMNKKDSNKRDLHTQKRDLYISKRDLQQRQVLGVERILEQILSSCAKEVHQEKDPRVCKRLLQKRPAYTEKRRK